MRLRQFSGTFAHANNVVGYVRWSLVGMGMRKKGEGMGKVRRQVEAGTHGTFDVDLIG